MENKKKRLELKPECDYTGFWCSAIGAIMFMIILMLLFFGSPLHDHCGEKACIQMEQDND